MKGVTECERMREKEKDYQRERIIKEQLFRRQKNKTTSIRFKFWISK